MPKQRYKIYKVEDKIASDSTTSEGMQMWLDWVVRTKWWKERSKIKHVRVVFPTVGKMSGAEKEGPHLACIKFGAFSLDQLTACHELGHILAWDADANDEEDHGPRFVATYLSIVKRFISAEFARDLANDFDEAGVRYSSWE